MTTTVQTDFGHQHRSLVRQILDPRQVGLERLARLEVDIEADEIQKRQLQVFGGWEIDVADQGSGVLLLHYAVQALDEFFDTPAPIPAHNGGGNFIANRVAEQRSMAAAGARRGADPVFDGTTSSPLIEESDVLFPRDSDHHIQPIFEGKVQQPARRHRVGTQRIDAVGGHLPEILRHSRRLGKLEPAVVGPESAVGDTFDPQFLRPDEQKLPFHPRSLFSRREQFGG